MSNLKPALSKKLSRRILLLAIPLFILALGVFYKNANVLLHEEAVERSVTTLNTTAQLVENYLTTIETAAKSNAWMLEEFFSPDSIETISRRIVGFNRSALSCSVSTEPDVFPQYGRYFSVYSVNEGDTVITVRESEFEYFEKNWYKIPLQTGNPCWINPFSDFSEGTINHHDAVGSYCIPLRPDGRHVKGVVSVDFSFKKLRETVLATHYPYPSSYYMLIGPAGGYLIHPDTKLLFKKTIFSATDSIEHPDIIQLGREMTSGHHGIMHITLDNTLCHVCYCPVAETGWSLALVCHDDDVLKDYNHLIIVTIVIVIIGLVLILLITRRVVQRNIGHLNELMVATKKLAEGDYDTLIPSSTHKDMVGKLQNAFRKMQLAIMTHMETIKANDVEIEKENAELEQILPLAQEASKRKQLFIQNVWRQISSPLNVIEGLIHVLQTNILVRSYNKSEGQQLQNEEMHNIAETMKRNAILLNRNTLMLFDVSDSRIADNSRSDRTDLVSCNELGRECVDYTMIQHPIKGLHFETELPDDCCVKTNRLYLMRTIRELLLNAAKFSDGQHVALRLKQTETAVQFIIEDVGPGLPKDLEAMIFEPFIKVDNLSEGLGLGLPLCKGHVVGLGGNLVYDANYQEGCRFIVEVPK